MGGKLHNTVRALWVYLVCCHQVLTFDVTKSAQTYIGVGSQTTLTCQWTKSAGVDLLRVNWRQGSTIIAGAILPNYTPIYPDSSVKDRVTLGTLTSTSTRTSITLIGLQCPGDIAEYSCDVQTTALQDSSGTASFDVNLFFLSFDVTKSGQTYIRVGSQTTLTCQWTPPAGVDLLRVNWRQGSTLIATAILLSFTPQYPTSRVRGRVTLGTLTSTSTSTSITLTGLQCPGDIAEYACEVITTAVQDNAGTASFNVNLFDFLGNNITITSSSSQLQAGQHASLTCTASNIGRPPGIMKWYKDSRKMTTGFTQQTSINSDGCTYYGGSILSITPTSQDHGVMYKCVVEPNSTVPGDSLKKGIYTLDVQYPVPQGPRVTSSTGTFTVEQGTTFTLNCQASGNPSPSYVWTSPDNTNSTGSQLVLTLSSTGEYLYTCFATNSLTTTPLPTPVRVTVQGKITTTTTISMTTSMTPVAVASSTDTLTCTGGEGLHSTGVLVGAVVAAVVITFGVAVALFVLYHRSMVHRFRKNRQSGDTVEVDAMESNNEYAVLDRKEVISKPDHTYAALQGRMTSFNTPPRK